MPAWQGPKDSPICGRVLASPTSTGEELVELLSGVVAAGQEDKARILPVGHGCLRPGGLGNAALAPPQDLQPGTSYHTWQEPSPRGAQQQGPGVVSVLAAVNPGSGPQDALGRCWQISTC